MKKIYNGKELDASDTAPDFPRLTFEELNNLTLGKLTNY